MIAIEKSIPRGVTFRDRSNSSVLARIAHYELIRELGGGGFGTVYLSRGMVSGRAAEVARGSGHR